jgi:hypothetical protein
MWNSLSESILREFGEKASVLRILHSRQAQNLVKWDRWLLVPSLLCSVSSAAMTTALSMEQDEYRYTAAVFAFLAAIFTSIKEHLKVAERTEAHKRASAAYGKIYRQVAAELSLARGQRATGRECLTKTRTALDQISEDAPIIDRKIINSFLSSFNNSDNIAIPEICNGLKRIQIRTDDDTADTAEENVDTFSAEP